MEPEKIAQLAVNYGLGIVLSIGMAVFLGWLLRYVLIQNEKREQRLSDLIVRDIAANTKSIDDHDERAVAAIKSIEEAHRRQREEHEYQKRAYEKIQEENTLRREAQIHIVNVLQSINDNLKNLNEKEMFFQKKRAP